MRRSVSAPAAEENAECRGYFSRAFMTARSFQNGPATETDRSGHIPYTFRLLYRLWRTAAEIVELEWQIIGLRLLGQLRGIFLRVCLLAVVVMLAMAGVVFLEVVLFRLLLPVGGVIFACLLFAGFHLLLAAILLFAIRGDSRRRTDDESRRIGNSGSGSADEHC